MGTTTNGHRGGATTKNNDDQHQDNHNNKKKNHHKKKNKKPTTDNNTTVVFPKLDSTQHARRIAQRRKAIQYGKNTAGYEAYSREVPKSQRRPRYMKHPTTPDHTLDIPTKRWQGLIKAWRKSLHHYDPPDLEKAMMETEATTKDDSNNIDATMQDKELAKAQKDGLLVDIQPRSRRASLRSDDLLQQWDKTREEQQDPAGDDEFDHAVLDDSDDDLL